MSLDDYNHMIRNLERTTQENELLREGKQILYVYQYQPWGGMQSTWQLISPEKAVAALHAKIEEQAQEIIRLTPRPKKRWGLWNWV